MPDPENIGSKLTLLDETTVETNNQSNGSPSKDNGENKRKRRKQASNKRVHVIPYDFTISIDSERINDIYIELKNRLYMNEHPNACAVLLRVFIELSIDHYLKYHDDLEWDPFKNLKEKGKLITQYLVNEGILKKNEVKPINSSFSNDHDLNSLSNLHGYVHHMDLMPTKEQLISDWQRFKPLIEIIWFKKNG